MTNACSCHECYEPCTRIPGWMTPNEANSAIEAGYANRLMRDYWTTASRPIFILCPLSADSQDNKVPETDFIKLLMREPANYGRCTFLNKNNLCDIHDSGFKPAECRGAIMCNDEAHKKTVVTREQLKTLWDTAYGRATILKWRRAMRRQP